jgi:hypothetical protein
MKKFDFSSFSNVDRISGRIAELRQALVACDPIRLAADTGSDWHPQDDTGGDFQLLLWKQPVQVAYPAWTAHKVASDQAVSSIDLALLLYYFKTADGVPLSGRWVSFADLPDGRFYNQAFQGYTGKQLARLFQDDRVAFEQAAQALGGIRQPLGDASFAFQALPRVPLLAVYWQGDEDFPSTCQVLFDAAASHYLPTDAYAILGSTLTRRLIKARR